MAQPKRKSSHSRAAKRATHKKLSNIPLTKCPNCGEYKQPHRVCPSCGYYKDKEVVSVEE
jgi:large subunit ribosomal protein L32